MITLALNDVFPKGKYKGKTVSQVIKLNPKYIIKESENLKTYAFSEKIIEMAYEEIITETSDDDLDFFV